MAERELSKGQSGNIGDLRFPKRESPVVPDPKRDFHLELSVYLSTTSAGKVVYRTFDSVEDRVSGTRCVLTISGHVAGKGFGASEDIARQRAACDALAKLQSGEFKVSPKKGR